MTSFFKKILSFFLQLYSNNLLVVIFSPKLHISVQLHAYSFWCEKVIMISCYRYVLTLDARRSSLFAGCQILMVNYLQVRSAA